MWSRDFFPLLRRLHGLTRKMKEVAKVVCREILVVSIHMLLLSVFYQPNPWHTLEREEGGKDSGILPRAKLESCMVDSNTAVVQYQFINGSSQGDILRVIQWVDQGLIQGGGGRWIGWLATPLGCAVSIIFFV